MIRPSKHSHPDKTVISACLVILTRMKARRHDSYIDLRNHLEHTIPNGATLFPAALNLLFLLGLIDYHPKNDAIEYTKAS